MMDRRTVLLLFLLVVATGCDEDEQERWRAYQRQIREEQRARSEAEERLAQERHARDREKQVAEMKVQHESRKSGLRR